jgi:hypothetical protein
MLIRVLVLFIYLTGYVPQRSIVMIIDACIIKSHPYLSKPLINLNLLSMPN